MEVAQVQQVDEGKYHPADMLMIDVKSHMEEQNRKALTFLSDRDPKQEMLMKHFKVIQGYERAFDEFIKKINDYQSQEINAKEYSMKTAELGDI